MRSTWDVLREMENLRRDLDSVFTTPARGRSTAPGFRYSFLPGRSARTYPLLNVSEDENGVRVDALAPGLDPETLDINVVQNQLSISGEKPAAGQGIKADAWHRNERAAGRFTRVITLPVEVEQEKASADYRNGILTVKLPKAEHAKPRKITVEVS